METKNLQNNVVNLDKIDNLEIFENAMDGYKIYEYLFWHANIAWISY